MNKGRLFFLFFTFFAAKGIFSQNSISYSGDRNYTLVERTDLSRYDNGKYSGLVAREVRSFITRSEAPDNFADKNACWYNGNFFVSEQTVHAKKEIVQGIHDSIPAVFNISSDGKLSMIVDNGFPSFRSFPAFPDGKLLPGTTWQSDAVRAVDPLNKGIVTKLQMAVAYTFAGEEKYHGQDVFRITARWATRYDLRHIDSSGDKNLQNANGTHEANILVSKETGSAILIHDRVDETFVYKDGLSVRFKGTISQFTEYPPSVEHKTLIPALQRIAKFVPAENTKTSSAAEINAAVSAANVKAEAEVSTSKAYNSTAVFADKKTLPEKNLINSAIKPEAEKIQADDFFDKSTNIAQNSTAKRISAENIKPAEEKVETDDFNSMVVEETAAGLRLSVRDIRFKPDSAEILTEELGRLDQIAEVLKLAPDSHFLVEGHSAATGNPKGELEISEQRAKTIARELSKRGIPAEHFICRGYGAEKPVSDNKTSKGKAQNRRVEITILE